MSDTDTGWDRGVALDSVGGGILGPSSTPRPGPDTVERRMAELPVIEQRAMNEAGALAAKLSPGVVDTYQAIRTAMHRGATLSGTAAAELQRLAGDDASKTNGVLNDAALQRVAELERKAPADVKAAFDAAADGIDVLAAQLVVGAMPKIEGQARADAVEEVRMLTDGLTGAGLISKFQQLAGGPNRGHAAVVVGSWGAAKLGGDDKLHGALQLLAIEGTKKYGTPEQRAHAEALATLPIALKKAVGASRFRASHRLGR